MMRYTQKTDWVDGGTVYQGAAAGMAIGSMHFDSENITVAFPQGKDDIWTSRLERAGQWRLRGLTTPLGNNFTNNSRTIEVTSPTPTADSDSLLAWNSSLEAMGSSVDRFQSTDRSRRHSIFYIGTDRKLVEVQILEKSWSMTRDNYGEMWPTADNPSSGIAVAYSEGESRVWIYYWSNNTIVQASRSSGSRWADPKPLREEDDFREDFPPELNKSSGLSTGAKAGIGVGVGVGALVAGVLGWLWLKRRNKRKRSGGSPEDSHSTEVKKDPAEMDGHERPAELDNHRRPAEMDGHGKPAELADRPSAIHELEG
ncbi:hypothetical protein NW766_000774 [Fusarium irregulare]|uniref:Fucose-specific lectin n=1 Tax=Fusarium irregulare TaxID=2494466 RepID=A0A9W8Q116_9HYPO|nr:hypothetical protein NW766_000774 [Fusarium irregulare]